MNMENDYADEHQAFAASRSTDYVYETGNRAVFHALVPPVPILLPLVDGLLPNVRKRRLQTS